MPGGDRNASELSLLSAGPLWLRQIDRQGARAILERQCPEGTRWASGYPTDGDLEAANLMLRRFRENDALGPFGIFEILEEPDDVVIGGIGFHHPPEGDGSVEVGYGIVEDRWNRGICTAALRAMVSFARDNGAMRLDARSLPGNSASRRVMEKAGLEFAGLVDGYVRYSIELSEPA